MNVIVVELPRGFMNCCVSVDGDFVADNNNSADFDRIKFPLPEGKWGIFSTDIRKQQVILTRQDKQ